VYLAGPIKGLSAAAASVWRDAAASMLAAYGVGSRSPVRYRYAPAGEAPLHGGAYNHPLATAAAISGRDHHDVQACQVMIANFLGADAASLGTAVEFGWASAYRKFIVLVIEKDATGNPHDHAILRHLADCTVHTVADAVRMTLMVLGVDANDLAHDPEEPQDGSRTQNPALDLTLTAVNLAATLSVEAASGLTLPDLTEAELEDRR